jgi:hypothetical protein
MRLKDRFLEQRAKGFYEALEPWKEAHDKAMRLRDLEDMVEESRKIWSEVRQSLESLWEELSENTIDDTESTGNHIRDALKTLQLAFRIGNRVVALYGRNGDDIHGAEDLKEIESDIEDMLARLENEWPWRNPGREERAKEDSTVNADDDFPQVGTKEWGTMNRRRAELIRKKNREGLTPEENTEYQRLQQLSQAALERAFPAKSVDRERLDRLEAQLKTASEAGSE